MDEASGFSIGELSRRTGVPVPTLRTWENRYGQPSSKRLAGGHRRYDETSVQAVLVIQRHRASGLSMGAAAAAVAEEARPASDSLFAGLRAAHPELPVHVLTKDTLLALTRAVEDEFVARAGRPVLFAAFQRARFFQQSRARWLELSRTASFAAVLADFPEHDVVDGLLHLTPAPPDSPALREWWLVCDSPGYSVCLVGWEQPEPARTDGRRRFETVWTVDPRVVRTAARLAARHHESHVASEQAMDRLLATRPTPPSSDLERATSLFQRLVGYLDSAGGRAPRS